MAEFIRTTKQGTEWKIIEADTIHHEWQLEEVKTAKSELRITTEAGESEDEFIHRYQHILNLALAERSGTRQVKKATPRLANTLQIGFKRRKIPDDTENQTRFTTTENPTLPFQSQPRLEQCYSNGLLLREITLVKGKPDVADNYRIETHSALSMRNKVTLAMLTLLSLAANLWFWGWWMDGKASNPLLYIIFTVCSLYNMTILPGMYLFYLWHMRYPQKVEVQRAIDKGAVKKVAVISLTVPGSESLEHVARQMKAMCSIQFLHDTWILVDKCHSPEIKALAAKYGVKYFSRHDIETWGESNVKKWNQPVPPYQAKTKAGNVNAWLDAQGQQYSHFTQLDIDHNPKPNYLDKVLGFFADQTVKWVQAPSVYRNFDTWTGKGSAEQEFVLQGPLQMGFFGFSKSPMIIGSHCTYDTKAVMEIGGFQPTRAEDHLDTILLCARGYCGVYLPEVIAEGDGPETFETYLVQQFAWAYSIIQILFGYTPKLLRTYGPKRLIQFMFVQTWYPFWSLSLCCLFVLPVLGLISGQAISAVGYFDFVAHSMPLAIVSFTIYRWSTAWHQPKGISLSWRGVVLHVARWPVVLKALVQVIMKVKKPYMITPKGIGNDQPVSLRAYMPYLGLIALNLFTCWVYISYRGQSSVQGYLFFALQGVFFMVVVYAVGILNEWRNITRSLTRSRSTKMLLKPLALLVLMIVGLTAITGFAAPHIIDAWIHQRIGNSQAVSDPLVSAILQFGIDQIHHINAHLIDYVALVNICVLVNLFRKSHSIHHTLRRILGRRAALSSIHNSAHEFEPQTSSLKHVQRELMRVEHEIELNPTAANLFVQRAELLASLGKHDLAAENYLQAQELQPLTASMPLANGQWMGIDEPSTSSEIIENSASPNYS